MDALGFGKGVYGAMCNSYLGFVEEGPVLVGLICICRSGNHPVSGAGQETGIVASSYPADFKWVSEVCG